MEIGYANVFVADLGTAIAFYRDVLGLELNMGDEAFGYASFAAGPITLGLAQTDEEGLVGRHTGIGFMVHDVDAVYEDLLGKGVEFTMPPSKQPWGGTLALFKDLDGNVFYLDPGHANA
jgi:predicted enzyme related to lactoylglutathione lyase